MGFPRYEGKYDDRPLFGATDMVEHGIDAGVLPSAIDPSAVVFVYQPEFYRDIVDGYDGTTTALHDIEVFALDHTGGAVGVVKLSLGAPMMAAATEILVEFDVDSFLVLEACGFLGGEEREDAVVVCDSAIRDEGTSYHYRAPSKYATASSALVDATTSELDSRGIDYDVGTTWSTDAIFRETREEVVRYTEEGVLAVEMQAATLFVVAEYREVEAVGLFVPSDHLSVDGWESPNVEEREHLNRVFDPAVDVLRDAT